MRWRLGAEFSGCRVSSGSTPRWGSPLATFTGTIAHQLSPPLLHARFYFSLTRTTGCWPPAGLHRPLSPEQPRAASELWRPRDGLQTQLASRQAYPRQQTTLGCTH
ncbi:hypothetical protein VUR80DRAFT_9823 [Thermomyces stellatus]